MKTLWKLAGLTIFCSVWFGTAQTATAQRELSLRFERDLDLKCCPIGKCPLVSIQMDLFKTVEDNEPALLVRNGGTNTLTISKMRSEVVLFEGFRVADIPTPIGESGYFEGFRTAIDLTLAGDNQLDSIDLSFGLQGQEVVRLTQRNFAGAIGPRRTAANRVGVNGPVDVYWFTARADEVSLSVLRAAQPEATGDLFEGQRQVLTDAPGDAIFKCVIKLPSELLNLL